MGPFIHKYNTRNACYIYDVNTNRILKADRIIYDIVDDIGVLSKTNIVDKWKGIYPKNKTKKVLASMEVYKKRGFFLPNRPSELSSPACNVCLKNSVNSGLQQLILNISERCNLRCKYCVYSGLYPYERTHSYRTMAKTITLRTIDYFLNHAQESDHVDISFYGGEPLISYEIIKETIKFIINRKYSKDINFHIDTNGTLLTDEMLKFILKNKIFIQVSLDGPQQLHDRYRVFPDCKGSFNIIMQNLRKIIKLDKDYYMKRVAFAVTLAPPYALLERDDFFNSEMFTEHPISPTFVDSFDTQFFDKYCRNSNSNLTLEIEALRTRYINARLNNTEPSEFEKGFFERPLIKIHKRELLPLEDTAPSNGICIPGVRRLFVTTEGMFYPCERTGNAFFLGDTKTGLVLSRILNLINHYLESSTPECIQCWAVRLCSLCFASSRRGDKLSFCRKKQHCFVERKTLHNALVTYSTILEQNPYAFDFVKKMIFT